MGSTLTSQLQLAWQQAGVADDEGLGCGLPHQQPVKHNALLQDLQAQRLPFSETSSATPALGVETTSGTAIPTRNHTIKWHAAVWTYPGLAVQPQLCRHCFETCHYGKRKRLTLLRGVRGLAGATSSFLPLAPGLLAAAAGGVCGLTVAGAAPGGGVADFEPGPLAGTGVGKRSLPAQEGNPWDCFAWATWQPSPS